VRDGNARREFIPGFKQWADGEMTIGVGIRTELSMDAREPCDSPSALWCHAYRLLRNRRIFPLQ